MTPESRAALQRIGAELDGHRQVRVRIGGIVAPDTAPVPETKETEHVERQTEARPATGSWPRTARRKRPAGRPRTSGATPPVGSISLRTHYEAQVTDLEKAYPSSEVVGSDAQGMWLKVASSVLDGIDRTATFLVAVPFAPGSHPRTWGFWKFEEGPRWIGPRHTNFPDGSVCAYVPVSGTWREGDRLDSLLDLYSVWALRHLHLEEFERWPGGQFSPHPFYSLLEFKADEQCSCDDEPLRAYGDCCRPKHLKMDIVALSTDFRRVMGYGIADRNPAKFVLDFINGGGDLPSVGKALAVPAIISR